MIQSEKIKNDYVYLSWLARCCMYINRFFKNINVMILRIIEECLYHISKILRLTYIEQVPG